MRILFFFVTWLGLSLTAWAQDTLTVTGRLVVHQGALDLRGNTVQLSPGATADSLHRVVNTAETAAQIRFPALVGLAEDDAYTTPDGLLRLRNERGSLNGWQVSRRYGPAGELLQDSLAIFAAYALRQAPQGIEPDARLAFSQLLDEEGHALAVWARSNNGGTMRQRVQYDPETNEMYADIPLGAEMLTFAADESLTCFEDDTLAIRFGGFHQPGEMTVYLGEGQQFAPFISGQIAVSGEGHAVLLDLKQDSLQLPGGEYTYQLTQHCPLGSVTLTGSFAVPHPPCLPPQNLRVGALAETVGNFRFQLQWEAHPELQGAAYYDIELEAVGDSPQLRRLSGFDWVTGDTLGVLAEPGNYRWRIRAACAVAASAWSAWQPFSLQITSLEDAATEEATSLRLWPNPSGGAAVQIAVQLAEERAEMSLFSTLGQRLQHWVLNAADGAAHTLTLPTVQLPKGPYLLRLRTAKGQIHTRKLIVD